MTAPANQLDGVDVQGLLDGMRDHISPPPDVRGSSAWKARVVEKVLGTAVQDALNAEDRRRRQSAKEEA